MVLFQHTLVKESKAESSKGEKFITKGHGTTNYQHRVGSLWTHSAFNFKFFPFILQATKKCMLRISLELGDQAPEMFGYSALYNWQHLVLTQKAGLCLGVEPGNLEEIGKGKN